MRLVVGPTETGRTLEALLTDRGGLDPALFRQVLAAGGVTVNRRRAQRPDQPLQLRDEVVAHVSSRGQTAQGPRPLDRARLLLLDDQLVAVDKAPGIAAQGTLVDAAAGLDAAVRRLLAEQGLAHPFVGLVHRLDLETSGVTLFGRTPEAVTHLSAQFREGTVRKRYLALAQGHPAWDALEADGPIAADPQRQGVYTVSPRGRPAHTTLRVLERFGAGPTACCLLEALPHTGRTHQIRVHARAAGHPLLGDRKYGGPAALTTAAGERLALPRVLLHAAELWCTHPAGGPLHVTAPLPADLDGLLRLLRALPR